jgi:hypothetical protein
MGVQPAFYPDGQALPAELIDDIEDTKLLPIGRLLIDKAVTPHMVLMLRS